jgi:hypothetical protein
MIKDVIMRKIRETLMTDDVTLTLTISEAEALNALALRAVYKEFAGLTSQDMSPLEELNPETVARAVDKLQRAVLPDLPKKLTMTSLLKNVGII